MNIKRQKKDQNVKVDLSVEINKLSEKTLVTVVDNFRIVMESNVSAVKAVGEMMKENAHMIGKMVDAITRLRHSMEDNERTYRSERTGGEKTKRAKSWKNVLITTGGDRRRGKVMTERGRPTGERKETEKSMVEGRRRRRKRIDLL